MIDWKYTAEIGEVKTRKAPEFVFECLFLVFHTGTTGFEPTIFGLTGRHVNRYTTSPVVLPVHVIVHRRRVILYHSCLSASNLCGVFPRQGVFTNYLGELAALGTATMWAFSSIVFTLGGQRVGSVIVNRTRLVVAVLFLGTAHWLLIGRPFPWDAGLQRFAWLCASGFVGLVIGDSMLFQCYVLIGARIGVLLMSLSPIFGTLLAWIVLGETLTLPELAAMTLALAGVTWVVLERGKNRAPGQGDSGDDGRGIRSRYSVRARRGAVPGGRPGDREARPGRRFSRAFCDVDPHDDRDDRDVADRGRDRVCGPYHPPGARRSPRGGGDHGRSICRAVPRRVAVVDRGAVGPGRHRLDVDGDDAGGLAAAGAPGFQGARVSPRGVGDVSRSGRRGIDDLGLTAPQANLGTFNLEPSPS